MPAFELLVRLRKELSLTGTAFYEIVVAIAERVNRKVQVLRLHGQATNILHHIHLIHRDVGRSIAEPADPANRSETSPSNETLRVAAERISAQRAALTQIENHIRELKVELAQEELLAIQRDLGLRDAAFERVTVSKGAPIVGHPLGEFEFGPTTRPVAVFRGPFLLLLSDSLTLRADDIVVLVGLRQDLARCLPLFQTAAASKSA